jgi:hypothetical protein
LDLGGCVNFAGPTIYSANPSGLVALEVRQKEAAKSCIAKTTA